MENAIIAVPFRAFVYVGEIEREFRKNEIGNGRYWLVLAKSEGKGLRWVRSLEIQYNDYMDLIAQGVQTWIM